MKESVSPQDVCDLLNDMVQKDKDCVITLINSRGVCNELIAGHPFIQVLQDDENGPYKIGLLGVLNGLFGIDSEGYGAIVMYIDAETKKIEFKTNLENQ